jgi:hypothetical protein
VRDGPEASAAAPAAAVPVRPLRCHGHRTAQPPSFSRVLIAAISCT